MKILIIFLGIVLLNLSVLSQNLIIIKHVGATNKYISRLVVEKDQSLLNSKYFDSIILRDLINLNKKSIRFSKM